jgi:hypothetical protein
MLRLLALVLPVLLLIGCGPSEAQIQATVEAGVSATVTAQQGATATAVADRCSPAGLAAYADDLETLLERYEAQSAIVGSTPRVGIGAPLQRLLDYEDEARALDTPACLENIEDALLAMMNRYRTGYQTFAAQGDETATTIALGTGMQLRNDLAAALPALRDGELPEPISLP